MFKEIDVNNKIDVYFKNMNFDMRRDDFYALMTYTFCNISFDDEMDALLYILPPKTKGPFGGMDVNVLIDGFNIGFYDDHLLKFVDITYEHFYVLVKRDNWKNQKIHIFGSSMDSNAYSYKVNSTGSTNKASFAFIKTIANIKDVTQTKVAEVSKLHTPKFEQGRSAEQLNDSQIQTLIREVAAFFLDYSVDSGAKQPDYESTSNPKSKISPPTLSMSMNMSKDGHKDIYMNLSNIGISLISPVVFAIKALTGMTYEMAMNSLLRPTLRQYFGDMRTFISLDNVFLFLLPPRGMDYTMALHVPEISVVYSKEWQTKDETLSSLKLYYDKREFEDEKVKSLISIPAKLPIFHMAVELVEVSMYLVDNLDLQKWCEELIRKKNPSQIDSQIDARMIMKPISSIGYHVQTELLNDKFKEVYFTRGVAQIDSVTLMMTSYDLHYLSEWSNHMNRTYWNYLKVVGGLDESTKKLIKNKVPGDWLTHMERTYKKKLDIDFKGLSMTLLDDVYETNMEYMRFFLHPIKTIQLDGNGVNGFTDIYTKIEAEYYNYHCKQWEPILEHFNLIIKKYIDKEYGYVTEIVLNNPQVCMNVTTELLCLVQGLQA